MDTVIEQSDAPLSISEPEKALERMQFKELPPALQKACIQAGWKNLLPVQSLALPYLLASRDLTIQSRTGSGKTGCYLLPLLHSINPEGNSVSALILVPTRELALQVTSEAETLFAGSNLRTIALYGGTRFNRQKEQLAQGVHVVVGTPGRILDHLVRRTLCLDGLRELVLDEADRMLSIGFYPDVKEIQRYLPPNLHTVLLSATYPPHVMTLAREFLRSTDILSLSHKEVHVASTEHMFCLVPRMEKDRALLRLIESENPSSAIIFCNTRANVQYVADVLKGFGYNAAGLSSDLSQSQREAVMTAIREEKLTYLVATDLASRGIDIANLSHVFLYEPPEDQESYIHRSGRTGRCGAAGTVISLVDIMEKMELERIAKHYHIPLVEMQIPTDEDVTAIVSNRLATILESRYRRLQQLEKLRVDRYIPMARELMTSIGEEEGSLPLIALLLDAFHRETMQESLFPSVTVKAAHKKRRRQRKKPAKHSAEN